MRGVRIGRDAWGLVVAAGLSTTIGASIVFCASLAQAWLLAISLGFAAGVMLYVSFAEIFMRKSVAGFAAVDMDDNEAYRNATFCFFGGMLFIAILDKVVHLVADCALRQSGRRSKPRPTVSMANLLENAQPDPADCVAASEAAAADKATASTPPLPLPAAAAGAAGLAAAPVQQHFDANGGTQHVRSDAGRWSCAAAGAPAGAPAPCGPSDGASLDDVESAGGDSSTGHTHEEPALVGGTGVAREALQVAAVQEAAAQNGSSSRQPPAVVEIMKSDHHNWALKKMGLMTGLAIFIHNIPEGLATFVGALADTSVGVGVAVAIALHNIPEGICVAMPIYYATGSKWKGFAWAFLSGISEPFGGLIGYLALHDNQDLAFAIVFGLVAGMMVYISIKELYPTALKYDPDDRYVSSSVIAGMVVMAGSLLLFTI